MTAFVSIGHSVANLDRLLLVCSSHWVADFGRQQMADSEDSRPRLGADLRRQPGPGTDMTGAPVETLRRRILVGPQLDGSPSWDPTSTLVTASRGTRARSSARRRRSRSRTSGRSESVCRWKAGCASLPSLTSESTASCGAATSSASRCGTFATATRWHLAPSSRSTRPSDRCSSRSRPRPALVGWLTVAWTMAAFCEEMFFRGYLMNRIFDLVGNGRAGWISALLVSSLLFGLAHGYQGLAGAIGTAEVGLLLGVMYLGNKRNLWMNIVCHGSIDSISLVSLYLSTAP
jgi:membrane protease YdiL (CAAX protease family)